MIQPTGFSGRREAINAPIVDAVANVSRKTGLLPLRSATTGAPMLSARNTWLTRSSPMASAQTDHARRAAVRVFIGAAILALSALPVHRFRRKVGRLVVGFVGRDPRGTGPGLGDATAVPSLTPH